MRRADIIPAEEYVGRHGQPLVAAGAGSKCNTVVMFDVKARQEREMLVGDVWRTATEHGADVALAERAVSLMQTHGLSAAGIERAYTSFSKGVLPVILPVPPRTASWLWEVLLGRTDGPVALSVLFDALTERFGDEAYGEPGFAGGPTLHLSSMIALKVADLLRPAEQTALEQLLG